MVACKTVQVKVVAKSGLLTFERLAMFFFVFLNSNACALKAKSTVLGLDESDFLIDDGLLKCLIICEV